ncbi:MAG: hypothetical protein KGJ80_18845, partial [Chloroflexota bacterium]|nr:hypothetical protein [Chloroflexota bacterium]
MQILTPSLAIVEVDLEPTLGGELAAENGKVRVQFPPNAVSIPVRLRYNRQTTDLSKDDRNHPIVVNRFALYAFDRANLTTEIKQFQKPITLTVQYDPLLLGSLKEQALMVVYWDTVKKSWQPLPSRVDTKAQTVTALTPHFTDFGLSNAPAVNTYLPNLQGFQTSLFTGSASASYGFDVPAGLGGLTPKLTLSYSSQATDMMGSTQQASYVGAGWSLSENYIARDTRQTYNTTDDQFNIVLNGAGYDLVLAADGKYHTADEQYWLIDFDRANDQWQVTANDGTVYRFGSADNSRAKYWRRDGYGASKQETYNWGLASVIDTHSNQINYSYQHEIDGSLSGTYWWVTDCPNRDSDMALYPQLITYNGGLTQVGFVYSDRTDYAVADGYNSGLCTRNAYQRSRLDRVDISTTVNSTLQLVRAYAFTYDYSTFPGVYFDHGDGTGASGRLTLKQMTQYGTDGVGGMALPTNVFTYANNRLLSVENGIGGKVTFAYDTFAVAHMPSDDLNINVEPYHGSDLGWKSNGVSTQWVLNDGHWVNYITAQSAPYYAYLEKAANVIPGAVYTYTVETLRAFDTN